VENIKDMMGTHTEREAFSSFRERRSNTQVDAHSQLLDGSQGPPMEELEKILKELKGSATL